MSNSPTTSVLDIRELVLDAITPYAFNDGHLTSLDDKDCDQWIIPLTEAIESYGDRRELEGRNKFITKAADAAFKQYEMLAEEESSIKAKLESQKENI